ncbi:MAG: LysM peptidoglycan-binding domain-containing protein [Verrucomicrobia bacterium]|nr:LysM peptidoglycan-binding domain-containing protein [Verrucomicrobiota bacterium]
MTHRRSFFALAALLAVIAGAGCGGGDNLLTAVETDDSYYQEGKQLQRQGRDGEALAAYLRVIEKRGDRNAPQSHLEAGQIYLQHVKNPIEALHHFNRFLELQPKSREAPYVRGLVNTAMKELARALPGRLLENQNQWLMLRDQNENLQRENDQLKAEIASLRGSAAPAGLLRVTRAPTEAAATAPSAPRAVATERSPVSVAPAPTPLLAGLAGGTATGGASAAGKPVRKHVVVLGDTLFRLATKYGVKLEELQAANRDVLAPGATTLKIGTELKIP